MNDEQLLLFRNILNIRNYNDSTIGSYKNVLSIEEVKQVLYSIDNLKHKGIRITQVYTHISSASISKVNNPFDSF